MKPRTPRKDLLKLEPGARYGRFTVVNYCGHNSGQAIWLFRCDCGAARKRIASAVVNGWNKQCAACQYAGVGQNKPIHTERDAVIVAARGNGVSVPQIARDMGLTPSTVHNALLRAKRRVVVG